MVKTFSLSSLLAIALLILSTTIACRPSGPSEDLGTVVIEVPEVPGAEEPYIIPELGPSTSDVQEAGQGKPLTDTPPDKPSAPKSDDNSPMDTNPIED